MPLNTQQASYSASISESMAAINATIAGNPSVTGSSVTQIQALLAQVTSTTIISDQLLNSLDPQMDSDGDATKFASGTDPATMAEDIEQAADDAQNLATAFSLSNTLHRLDDNIADILS